MHELVLASQSPRRKHILENQGYQFGISPVEISEILNKNLSLPDQISDCARQKVVAAMERYKPLESQDVLFLGADTLVIQNQQPIGKPTSSQHAITILEGLSGQVHDVITGFCLCDLTTKRLVLGHDCTHVRFRKLTTQEIRDYVETGDPMDKAGAYGIQGAARKFVESFDGSLNNVIGLPIEKIEEHLRENDWILRKKSQ